jgi:outer membrane receptor protein involved in Fe transport
MRLNHSAAALATGAAMAIFITPAQAQETATDRAEDVADAGDIVVTAQRRTERAQDVPSSLTVLGADALSTQGAVSLADYARQIPTLNIIGSQGAGTGQPTMRGVSTGGDRVAGVGIYLDDVPFTPASAFILATSYAFDPDLADIDRIEVLAGPQSTLYGASAMGGLIRYISKQPDLNALNGSARLFLTGVDGGSVGGGGKASVSIPLVTDQLAVATSGFWRRDPGFVDNLTRGESNVNRADVYGGRIAIRARFSERFETTFIGLLQNIDRQGPNIVYLTPDLKPAAGLSFTSPLDLPTRIRYRSISAQSTLDLDFAVVSNILSYSNFAIHNNIDYSYFSSFFPTFPAGGAVDYNGHPTANKYTEELRIASKPGRFEWMIGGFITKESGSNALSIYGTGPDGIALPSTSPFLNVYTLSISSSFVEKAAYGNLTLHVTPELAVAGGLRYSANRQTVDPFVTGLLGSIGTSPGSREDAVTYHAAITYAPSRQLTIYAKTSSAYRPGSSNPLNAIQVAAGVPQDYSSDYLRSYELGVKGSAMEGRLSFTADVFHMKWSDIQTSQIVSGFSAVANGGSARIDGAEASLSYRPTPGLTVAMSGAWLDAKYTGSVPTANIFKGDRLPYAPKFSGTVSIDYGRPQQGLLTPVAGISFTHRGAQQTPVTNATTYRLPAVNQLDLYAGIEWDRYRLVARVDNLTDEFGLTSAGSTTALGQPLGGSVIRPRTYSLSLETRF